MAAARGDADLVVDNFVHEAMFVGDPARPVAVKAVLQLFRLSYSFVSVSCDISQQRVDAREERVCCTVR